MEPVKVKVKMEIDAAATDKLLEIAKAAKVLQDLIAAFTGEVKIVGESQP